MKRPKWGYPAANIHKTDIWGVIMKRRHLLPYISVLSFLFSWGLHPVFSQDPADEAGCKDHPLFSRMKNFYIYACESTFDAVEFNITEEATKVVEGQKTLIDYSIKEGAVAPSGLQIKRNYANAVKTLGGTVVYEGEFYECWKIVKNNREIWTSINVYNDGNDYRLTVVEISSMTQEVTANDMLEALNRDGFMALYINFDTGKAVIKPESQSIIDQIATLLSGNPDLTLSIEGHTDNIGTPESNRTLSMERAKSVMNAVTGKGIGAARIKAVGWGQEKPVADNRTEEGRAKNRRVEIVKQ